MKTMSEAEHIALSRLHKTDTRRVSPALQDLYSAEVANFIGFARHLTKNNHVCPECNVVTHRETDHLVDCSLGFLAGLERVNIGGLQNDPDICNFVYFPRRKPLRLWATDGLVSPFIIGTPPFFVKFGL